MKAEYIVYVSNTGHTERYAKMLAEKIGLTAISYEDAKKKVKKKTKIIFMGWLLAGDVKGYKKANKKFEIVAVCGVGLCPTGELLTEIRQRIKLAESIPLFTLQGGIERSKLKGLYKSMINMLEKIMIKKSESSNEAKELVKLLRSDKDYVDETNLNGVINWYNE